MILKMKFCICCKGRAIRHSN